MIDLARTEFEAEESCFDIISVHPYHADSIHRVFWAEKFQQHLDTVWSVIRAESERDYELWASEMGWPEYEWDTLTSSFHSLPDVCRERNANNLCKLYVSAIGSQQDPWGRYDRVFLYELSDRRDNAGIDHGGFGLLDSQPTQVRKDQSYAFEQFVDRLAGKRLNRRVLQDDDDVRIYEFEDTTDARMWVCWKSDGAGGGPVDVQIPVRCDDPDTLALAYDDDEEPGDKSAELDGWLSLSLDEQPVFVTETDSASRPDLVVDSVRLVPERPQVGQALTITAWVRNHGNGSVPVNPPGGMGYYWNDSLLTDSVVSWPDTIHDGSNELVFYIDTVPASMHGSGLLRVAANPDQDFVELDMDDNSHYQELYIPNYPTGVLDVVVPPSGRSDVPLVLLHLQTFSWEKDTSGQTPADSVRLQSEYFLSGDTLPLHVDSTDWFGFVSDTNWQFLRGEGRYVFKVQAKDSSSNVGPWATGVFGEGDSFVLFDSTPPTGTFALDDGARFTNAPCCSIMSSMIGTLAGLHMMRFCNQDPTTPVLNPRFCSSDGEWVFSSGCDFSSLDMAELDVPEQPEDSSWVRQDIGVGVFGYDPGDTMSLSVDVVTMVPDCEETEVGVVKLWYKYVPQDPPTGDSWYLVAETTYTGGMAVRAGLEPLQIVFELPEHPEEPEWTWSSVRLEAFAFSPGGPTGKVWLDNVRLVPVRGESECEYTQFQDYVERIGDWPELVGPGEHTVYGVYMDSAGNENYSVLTDDIVVDPQAPAVSIESPEEEAIVSGVVEVTGWAYDSIIVVGDTFFDWYRLSYRHADSTEWLPVDPDSVSYSPAWPDWEAPVSQAVELGDWDTQGLEDAHHWLRLRAADSAGNTAECSVYVKVDNTGDGEGGGDGPEGGGSSLGKGSVYVGSRTGWMLHLDEDFTRLDSFYIADSGTAACASAMLKVSDDSMLVVDARAQALRKMSRQGRSRRSLATGLGLVTGMCRDEAGNIWLCDQGRSRIARYTPGGGLLITRGGPPDDSITWLKNPEAIATHDRHVYVADTRNNRIAIWDTSGAWVGEITGDFYGPQALAVTDRGGLYIVDKRTGRLLGINRSGGRYLTITKQDSTPFKYLCLSEDQYHVFTTSPSDNRVTKYRIRTDDSMPGGGQQSGGRLGLPLRFVLHSPRPNPARRNLGIRYGVPWTARVTIRIYDITGRKARTLVSAEQKAGWYDITWDRRDDKGRGVPAGVYFCTLETPDHTSVKKAVLVR